MWSYSVWYYFLLHSISISAETDGDQGSKIYIEFQNLSLVSRDCENNMAAYSAFHLDKYINLTEVINFDDVR